MESKAITTDLLRSAIKIEGTSGEGFETRIKTIPLKEVLWLQFSFRGIKQIDYLVGFDNLTRLQLDNNNIFKINNLAHLVTLTELDLSFNQIEKIENLSKLTRLVDLSLYNNKITALEGLDALEDLKSLSLGNNQIKELEKVRYLRQFRELRLLCLEGNPLCKDPEYKLFTIAYMRNLLYLDHHLCFGSLVKQAKEVYQDAMQELKDKEHKEEIAWKERKSKQAEHHLFNVANLLGIDEFLDDMLKNDPEQPKLEKVPRLLDDALSEYRDRFVIVADEVKGLVVELHNKREEERRLHKIAVSGVLTRRDGQGRALIRALHKKKKKVFQECQADRTTAEPKLTELLKDTERLQEALFEIEVDTYGEVNKLWNEFEDTFYETIDQDKNHFANLYPTPVFTLRMAENRYSDVISATAWNLMDKYESGELDVDDADAIALLQEKEVFQNAIQASRDAHGLSMDQAEDVKVKGEEALRAKTYNDGVSYMIQRNREKLQEIWFIVNKYQDEINNVLKQVLYGDVSSF